MRILSLNLDEILKITHDMEQESKQYKFETLKLCWYMRGSITIDDAYALGHEDREMIGKIVKENLETTKKSGLPFF